MTSLRSCECTFSGAAKLLESHRSQLTYRLDVSTPTSPLNRRLPEKMPISLTGADTIVWSEIGRKEGCGCTNFSCEFVTTLSRKDIAQFNMLYAAVGCSKERV